MERAKRAVELAEVLLREARAGQTAEERARAERLARLMEDPRGKELTIALTDQCFRSRRPERIADQLHYLLERYGAPRFMEWWERIGLTLGAVMGHYLPSLVVPPIVARLRHETESLILPGEDAVSLGLTGEETITILDIASGVTPKKRLTVHAGSKSFEVIARVDTPQEVEYVAHGGILQYVLRQLAA